MKKIHARKTLVKRIENNMAQNFIELYHSQGSVKGTFKKRVYWNVY